MRAPILLLTITLLLGAMPAMAAKPPVFSTQAGAIRGYDPVAYFTVGKAVKGLEQFTYEWNGAQWHFSSAENQDKFQADPDKFAPKFGGYCAYAMSTGSYAATEPEAFTIRAGVLYLNYSQSIQKTWLKDVEGFIVDAIENWIMFQKS